jgi:hypothetical protein
MFVKDCKTVILMKKGHQHDAEGGKRKLNSMNFKNNSSLRIFFCIINDVVHRFILDRTFVDFTVSLLILPFDIVDFNSKMVKSTVKS